VEAQNQEDLRSDVPFVTRLSGQAFLYHDAAERFELQYARALA